MSRPTTALGQTGSSGKGARFRACDQAAACHRGASRRQPTDRIPIYQAVFSSRVASSVLGREAFVGGAIQQYREATALWNGPAAHAEFLERSFADACELCEKLDLDLVRTVYWRWNERPVRKIDERTFEYVNGEIWRFDPDRELYGRFAGGRGPLGEGEIRRKAEDYSPTEADFPDYKRTADGFSEVDRMYMPFRKVRQRFPRLVFWEASGARCYTSEPSMTCGRRPAPPSTTRRLSEAASSGAPTRSSPPTPEASLWAMMDTLHALR